VLALQFNNVLGLLLLTHLRLFNFTCQSDIKRLGVLLRLVKLSVTTHAARASCS